MLYSCNDITIIANKQMDRIWRHHACIQCCQV